VGWKRQPPNSIKNQTGLSKNVEKYIFKAMKLVPLQRLKKLL
jgi:hypothetical protein